MKTFTEEQPLGKVKVASLQDIYVELENLDFLKGKDSIIQDCQDTPPLVRKVTPKRSWNTWFQSARYDKVLATISHIKLILDWDTNLRGDGFGIERRLYFNVIGTVEDKDYALGDSRVLELRKSLTLEDNTICYFCKYGINLAGV